VIVNVTVLLPIKLQSNIDGETDAVKLQLSLTLSVMSEGLSVARPVVSFKMRLVFWQFTTGLTVSSTVTVALHELLFPEASVAVKETVLAPMLAQVKDVCPAVREIIAQLSVELLLISAAVIEAAPLASR
jgi:hypothetical protein